MDADKIERSSRAALQQPAALAAQRDVLRPHVVPGRRGSGRGEEEQDDESEAHHVFFG